MRSKYLSAILAIGLFVGVLSSPVAVAAPIGKCQISTSPNQSVSLGFPMAAERLKDKPNPKLLVLPYRLSDRPSFTFGEGAKSDYLAAANQIDRLSGGKTKPEIVFSEVIDIPDTVADMVQLRRNQQNAWNRDETKSTWGFIRRVIALSDSRVDFTGIDGVLLHGSSNSNDSWIAEAMMFSKNPRTPWFRTIITAENELLNAVLFDKQNSIATISHEIMHLYGLTDLYGTDTGPNQLSLMASNADGLLSYEKWILGWVPDGQVQCLDEKTEVDQNKVSTRLIIPFTPLDQVMVINTGVPGRAYIIETSKSRGSRFLAFYSLDNEARPPITMHPSPFGQRNDGISVSEITGAGVGVQLNAPQYSLLVSDVTAENIVLDLIPRDQIKNATALLSAAAANRERFFSVTEAKTITPKKKVTICVSGKTVKKVFGKKAKCPPGFKKRR